MTAAKRLLGSPPGLQEGREVVARTQLRNTPGHRAGPGVPLPIPETIPGVGSPLDALTVAGAAAVAHVQPHQALGHKADHLAHDIVGAGLFKQLGKLHPVMGHRFIPQ